uniref:Uncharacterized protein n=1 Tax=Timema cristinae TaxID=61476 RepID=A0A7R9CPJ7_TIMCR|nr:unnamed protein product [Timema cristinae]
MLHFAAMVAEEKAKEACELENKHTMAVTLDLNKLGVVAGQLCRVCARLSQRLTPIFGQKGIEIDLATKIHTHLPIMVTEDDLMPVCLCEPCIHKLQVCHNLVNTCLEGWKHDDDVVDDDDDDDDDGCYYKELIDLEKEEPSEKAATLEDKNQETEHKQEESDDDFVWEENQSAVDVIPPSPPPDEIRPQRVAKRGRPRKFPVPQEIKQVIKNQRYKIVVVKMKSKRPLTQEELIKMLKARDPNNDLFKSGAPNILQKVDVQPGNEFTQGKEDSEQVLMDLTDEPTNQSATSLDHSSIAYYQDTNKKQSLNSEDKFKCVYCNIALVGTESLLAHHSSIHPDKVFICNQCTPPLVFYESKHAFDLHMLNHLEAEEGEIRTCMSEDANNIGELANEHIDQSNTSSKKHQALESQNRFTRTDLEPAPKDVFSYLCSYCKETLIGTDMFLAHQSQMHPDKVFTCTICKPHVVFYETKELFERHMLCHPQEIIERDDSLEESVITALDKPATEDYAETLPTGTTDENVSVSTPDDASVLITASNEVAGTSACPIDVSTLIKDDSENNFSFVDAPIPYQENPVDTFTFSNAEIPAINSDVTDVTTSDPSHKQPDNLEITTIFNVQVETPNILTGISEHQINSNLRMKLSKEFQGVSKSLQSRIIETIQKIASTKKSNQSRLALKRPYNLKVKKTIMKRKRLRSKFGWYCRQCDLKFDSSEELETHKSANTCSTHPCQYCGKLFHSKKILLEHERLHTNERPYMCEYCGKSFRTCTMLRTHHNSHSTNQTFVCPDCGKSYNNKASFHYHAATHNSQEFLCDICGKKLKHAGSLRIHKLKHSNPDAFKRVSCDICGNLYESRYI